MSKRMNINDVLSNDFYQIPKVIFWEKEYRLNLSDGAKLLYSIVRDRMNLSLYRAKQIAESDSSSESKFNYIDENGDVYCILDNVEIEYTMNKSDKTVKKLLDELVKVDLIDLVKEKGKAHKIYLNVIESEDISLDEFMGGRDYFKYLRICKKKNREVTKTEADFINERLSKRFKKQDKENIKRGDGSSTTPVSESLRHQCRNNSDTTLGSSTTPVSEDLRPSNNYTKDTNSNYNESNDTYVTTSSKNALEEVEEVIDFQLLDTLLNNEQLFTRIKDRNVIKKIIRNNCHHTIIENDIVRAMAMHDTNIRNYEIKNQEVVKYEPAFFANFLIDISATRIKKELNNSKEVSSDDKRDTSFYYNWLEEADVE